MRLDPKCIRDILITIEENTDFSSVWSFNSDCVKSGRLCSYTYKTVIYHISQCSKSGLIDGCVFYDMGDFGIVSDLSPYGHELLANIRIETVWNKLKDKTSLSIPVLFNLAKDLALSYFQGMIQ